MAETQLSAAGHDSRLEIINMFRSIISDWFIRSSAVYFLALITECTTVCAKKQLNNDQEKMIIKKLAKILKRKMMYP